MTRAAAFFLSDQPGDGRTRILLRHGGEVFIRVQEFDHDDVIAALDDAVAHVQPDEVVMNSHQVTTWCRPCLTKLKQRIPATHSDIGTPLCEDCFNFGA